MSETQTPTAVRWYLSPKGKVEGPFTDEDIVSKLLGRSLSPETLACPDGGPAWKPLEQWSEFVQVITQLQPKARQLPPIPAEAASRPILDWIALLYGLVINPIFLCIGLLALVVNCSDVDSNAPLGQAQMWVFLGLWMGRSLPRLWMIVAGIKLLRRKPSWSPTMAHGMWGLLLFSVGYLPLMFSILLIVVAVQPQTTTALPGSGAEALLGVFIVLSGVGELIGIACGLFWLCREMTSASTMPANGGPHAK